MVLRGIAKDDRGRAASTAIYFLLPAGTFSALHRVTSDEAWHHYDGDPVDLHLFDEPGESPARASHRVVPLGRDFTRGERPDDGRPRALRTLAAAVDLLAAHGLTNLSVIRSLSPIASYFAWSTGPSS